MLLLLRYYLCLFYLIYWNIFKESVHHCRACMLTVPPDGVQTHVNISDCPKINHPHLPGLQRSNLPLVGHQEIIKAFPELHMKHLTNEESGRYLNHLNHLLYSSW